MPRRISQNRTSALGVASLLAGALLLLPCVPATAAPQHHKHEARDVIASMEQQWRQAQLDADVSAMDKLLSDDFLGITSAGEVVTKAQQLDRMRTRKVALTQLDISDVKIKVKGEIAIVTSLAKIQGSNDDRPLNGSFRYTHIFQRSPTGVWKITSFQATRTRQPGDPANPNAQPPKP